MSETISSNQIISELQYLHDEKIDNVIISPNEQFIFITFQNFTSIIQNYNNNDSIFAFNLTYSIKKARFSHNSNFLCFTTCDQVILLNIITYKIDIFNIRESAQMISFNSNDDKIMISFYYSIFLISNLKNNIIVNKIEIQGIQHQYINQNNYCLEFYKDHICLNYIQYFNNGAISLKKFNKTKLSYYTYEKKIENHSNLISLQQERNQSIILTIIDTICQKIIKVINLGEDSFDAYTFKERNNLYILNIRNIEGRQTLEYIPIFQIKMKSLITQINEPYRLFQTINVTTFLCLNEQQQYNLVKQIL